MTLAIRPESTVLFIGDSITDAGRDRENPSSLGSGYAAMTAGRFTAEHPGHRVRFLNRGIGGNRAIDLVSRWDTDCLALKPDVVSIMVGVNDVCRRYDNDDPTPVADFAERYRRVLTATVDQGASLILLEPFLVPVREQVWDWREDLDPKVVVVRRMAHEFGATLVATDGLMAQAATASSPAEWSTDGVHPTPAGHALIAGAWLAAVTAQRD
ncbi:SGNH/GDSL hydrolase family protein [Rugosimonospora acidiphila]|uniref:SGNH/GDSL hydrolase family protein n=1 Tax=Rugosimonospora acidiphila TaxID=556531 RepID=A0ABP9SN71_9ACTN